jgi:hypothetical protein
MLADTLARQVHCWDGFVSVMVETAVSCVSSDRRTEKRARSLPVDGLRHGASASAP